MSDRAQPAQIAPPSARAALLAFGATTGVGASATASCAAWLASVCRFTVRHSAALDDWFTIQGAACLPRFDHGMREPSTPRLAELTAAALDETLSRRSIPAGTTAPVLVAIPSPRPGLAEDAAGAIRDRIEAVMAARGVSGPIVTFAEDHAGGASALARALAAIGSGEHDVCIVGGVDSFLHDETLAWLHGREQLKSERNRWGFVPGEAAAFTVVASPAWAAANDRRPLAWVLAASTAREEVVPRGKAPLLGVGLVAAARGAIAALPEGERVDEAVTDLNGERWRGDDIGFAMARLGEHFARTGRFAAPATSFGDVGAATGPLFWAAATHAAARGFARGPNTLVCTSAEAGGRGAVLLRTPVMERE